MESRNIVLMNLFAEQQWTKNRHMNIAAGGGRRG